MKRIGVLVVLATLLPTLGAWAGGPRMAPVDYDAAQVAAMLGGRSEHPHLLGTAMFFARWFHPGGTSGLHLALYTVPAGTHPSDLDRCDAQLAKDGWSRMIKTVEGHGSEQTGIYVRQRGQQDFDMLIVNLERGSELTVIRLHANPRRLVEAADQGE